MVNNGIKENVDAILVNDLFCTVIIYEINKIYATNITSYFICLMNKKNRIAGTKYCVSQSQDLLNAIRAALADKVVKKIKDKAGDDKSEEEEDVKHKKML